MSTTKSTPSSSSDHPISIDPIPNLRPILLNSAQKPSRSSQTPPPQQFGSPRVRFAEDTIGIARDPTAKSRPLLRKPSQADDELRSFRHWLRWMCVDQTAVWSTMVSWVVFLMFGVAVPAFSHFVLSYDERKRTYDTVVEVSLTAVSTLSFVCISTFVKKYGLRRFLFLDKLVGDSEMVRKGYTSQLTNSFKILSFFVLPTFAAETCYKVWWHMTFGVVLGCLVKGLDIVDCCQIFDDFVAKGGKPCFGTYETLIVALLKKGKVTEGYQRVQKMMSDGVVCSIISYNMMIDCFSKVGMMDTALEIFEKMVQSGFTPSIVSFNTLISGNSRIGKVDQTRRLLKMLLLLGLKPDVFTFSSIIDGLCRAYQVEDAFGCYCEMIEWGIAPNAVVYNIMIRSLCASGQVSKATKLFTRMKARGINPDVYSFNALIVSFCKMKMIEKAQYLLESMLRFDITPDLYTYNAFIQALCDARKVDEAKEIVQAIEDNGLTPNSHSYTPVLDALSIANRIEEAKELVCKCIRKGIHIDIDPNIKFGSELMDVAANGV